MEITTKYYAKNRTAWRRWLERNHAKVTEIWLVYDKKAHNEKRVTYQDALDEALCFGWIDGQAKGIDAKQYAQRFTPRRAKSIWSGTNVRHYERLLKAVLVSEHGKRVFDAKHRIYDPRAESPLYRLRAEFKKLANPAKAKILGGYFKTGKGEYGYGDKFYGLTVPQTRVIARKYEPEMSLARIKYLLQIGKHEERLCALFMLIEELEKDPKKVFDFYLANTTHVNNWDLVDSSAYQIVGAYLAMHPDMKLLKRLAQSKSLWEQRIAIVATYAFIKNKTYTPTITIATILLKDKEDLIHKAVGWMLREVGKKDEKVLKKFLDQHASRMPRTMLRYAIEKFPQATRKKYLEMV